MSDDIEERLIEERLAARDRELLKMRRRDTREHYVQLGEANAKGIKVAWTPAGWVSPLLDACGVLTCCGDNYAANCASRQVAGRFIEVAEARGISPDLCSYGRCIIGMMAENDGPFGPMPRPDLLILDPMPCDLHAKMWEIPARHYGAACFWLDGGFYLDGKITKRDIDYRVAELRRLVAFCEEQLGVKFDYDRFKQNMIIEGQVRTLFQEIQELRKSVPSPRTTREAVGDIFHSQLVPYTQGALDYFTQVAESCRDRVKHKIGVVKNERFRLFYDNIPLWFWMSFFDYFEARGAAFASDYYSVNMFNGYYAQGGRFDPEQPFESLALRTLYMPGLAGCEPMMGHFAHLVEDWHCDGAVFFSNRSCKTVTSARLDKEQMIRSRFGIPILEFEGDMAYPQNMNKSAILERADMFLLRLEEQAASRRLASADGR